MEGSSLLIASEQLQPFCGLPILKVTGNTKIGKERFENLKVKDIFSWGKHLVFQFDTFAIRVHFLLFGTYEATVNGVSVTGDYKRAREPRLAFEFKNGSVQMFNCSIKFIESANARETYDFSIDILAPAWSSSQALTSITSQPDEQIADVLLDQDIFAGVGNIIKNEVLFLTQVHPKTKICSLNKKKLVEIIDKTRSFSQQFYDWKKIFELRKHLVIYQKKACPVTGDKIIREKTGKKQRWSFICPTCQKEGNAETLSSLLKNTN